jgi:hypothetical protein
MPSLRDKREAHLASIAPPRRAPRVCLLGPLCWVWSSASGRLARERRGRGMTTLDINLTRAQGHLAVGGNRLCGWVQASS